MVEITSDHVEWALVDRMRQMLEAPRGAYLATQTYAIFSAMLCWIIQHIRIPEGQQQNVKDRAAAKLLRTLSEEVIAAPPWSIPVTAPNREVQVGGMRVQVPGATHFTNHRADRFLKNLRDAMAHGDARTVQPFNCGNRLVGFTFCCSERTTPWVGQITLVRDDMRRIGGLLALRYLEALQEAGHEQHVPDFPNAAATVLEDGNERNVAGTVEPEPA